MTGPHIRKSFWIFSASKVTSRMTSCEENSGTQSEPNSKTSGVVPEANATTILSCPSDQVRSVNFTFMPGFSFSKSPIISSKVGLTCGSVQNCQKSNATSFFFCWEQEKIKRIEKIRQIKISFFKASPFLGNKGLETGLSRVNLDCGVHRPWRYHTVGAIHELPLHFFINSKKC